MQSLGEQFVHYPCLSHNLVEQECRTAPGPVEAGVQVGALGASSLEVNVAHLALLPKPVQTMTTEVLYWEIHKIEYPQKRTTWHSNSQKHHLQSLPAEPFYMHRWMSTQKRSSSSEWREAELLVAGCPGCGYWRGREAYLAKGCCQLPLTLHSEKKNIKHTILNWVNTKAMQCKGTRSVKVQHKMYRIQQIKQKTNMSVLLKKIISWIVCQHFKPTWSKISQILCVQIHLKLYACNQNHVHIAASSHSSE